MPRKSETTIPPTPGRIVWFWPRKGMTDDRFATIRGDGPLAAIITKAVTNTIVNLTVYSEAGHTHPLTGVKLFQGPEDAPPPQPPYAAWMPYQIGQAARAQALEAKIEAEHGNKTPD